VRPLVEESVHRQQAQRRCPYYFAGGFRLHFSHHFARKKAIILL
jgi:hypothetical protein